MIFTKEALERRLDTMESRAPRLKHRAWNILLIAFLLAITFGIVLSVSLVSGAVRGVLAASPKISSLDVRPTAYATTLLDRDGNPVRTLVMKGSHRIQVHIDQIPKHLQDAFIAIEDERFRKHDGVDIKGLFRAAFLGLSSGRFREGASTITQQLIKNNVFQGGAEKSFGDRLVRKLQEQHLALQIDRELSKNTILEYYLNTINLGSNTLGVQAASLQYFHKEVQDLNLSECAVIAAITQNPSKFNPIRHPEKNRERRDTVLRKMLEQGMITSKEMEEALNDNVYQRIQTVSGSRIRSFNSYFDDAVIESVKNDLQTKLGYTETQAHNMLYSGGLTIETTMDPKIQRIAEEEVNDPRNYPVTEFSFDYSLDVKTREGGRKTYNRNDIRRFEEKRLNQRFHRLVYPSEEAIDKVVEEFKKAMLRDGDTVEHENLVKTLQPQASFVLMDQRTGQVLAIVGGRGEKLGNLYLNRATDSLRQPGSTFKILTTYAPALDTAGKTLASVFYDAPYFADGQNFTNFWGNTFMGYITMREAIVYSVNTVAAKCLMEVVTPNLGFEYAKNFGISTLVDSLKTDRGVFTDKIASLALGGITKGVKNIELTAAYAAIADKGVYHQPVFYTRILQHDGSVLLENTPETHTVIKPSTAWLLTDAMKETVNGTSTKNWKKLGINPTGAMAKVPGMTIAGKSGTTTSAKDVWFVGYSPYYTAGIWSGYDENKPIQIHNDFHKVIWSRIMKRVHEGKEDIGFPEDPELVKAKICSKSGLLAIDGVCTNPDSTSEVYEEYFVPGTEPKAFCDRHVLVRFSRKTGKPAAKGTPPSDIESKVFIRINASDEEAGKTLDSEREVPQAYSAGKQPVYIPPDTEETEPESTSATEAAPREHAPANETTTSPVNRLRP